MPRREDDDVARGPRTSGTRSIVLIGGFALAVLATLAVFLTDNPQYLRIAVVAVAWAFVLAAFAAGRRGSDRAAAAAREKELRRIYERELDREVAARREYELELENELRRETEDAMRYELEALRGDIAALSGLRDEVARVTELRGDIAALGALRDEVARVSALRDEVASLSSLRHELGQLAELRADMGRLRAELTEQLSSEMLVERLVMRTQAFRLPSEAARSETLGRTLDAPPSWTDDTPPRELTGGWPAVRLDEPREHPEPRAERPAPGVPPAPPTAQAEAVSGDRPGEPSWRNEAWPADSWRSELATPQVPPTTSWPAVSPSATPAPAPSPLSDFDLFGPSRSVPEESRSRHAADEADAPLPGPAAPPAPATEVGARPSPRPRPRPTPSRSLPEVPPRRRRTGESVADPATALTPAVPAGPRPAPQPPASKPPVAQPPAVQPPAPTAGPAADRPADGTDAPPPSGRRQRRRYREDDEQDDVLARVLRGN